MKLSVILACCGVLFTANARASPSPGTVAIAGSLAGNGSTFRAPDVATARSWSIAATPSIDLFASRGVTVGAGAQLAWHRSRMDGGQSASSTSIQPGLQVGYYVPIGERAAFWPVVRVGYGGSWSHAENNGGSYDATSRSFEVSLTPQFLLRPTEAFFISLAPGAFAHRTTEVRRPAQGAYGGLFGFAPMFALGVGVML